MTKVGEVDFLGDERTQATLSRLSLGMLAAFVVLGVLLVLVGLLSVDELGRIGWIRWMLALVVGSVVPLPVHELVHAILFRLMGGPGTKVRFGAAQGMLYAGCPGIVLPKGRFCLVLVGPAVLVTTLVFAIPWALGLPLLAYAFAALHLCGCVGDLLAVCRILREPRCTHVEDTDSGVRLLAE